MLKNLTQFEFWETHFENALTWTISTMPIVLITIALFLILKKIIRTFLNKFQERLVKKYGESHDSEGVKRVDTLTRLFNSIITIALNVILVLIILSQLGINIGPLLAGAGIAGLAIGFGSQELVRDVISGFFIILEDQIRVGDVV